MEFKISKDLILELETLNKQNDRDLKPHHDNHADAQRFWMNLILMKQRTL
jgi:hypothetical protein